LAENYPVCGSLIISSVHNPLLLKKGRNHVFRSLEEPVVTALLWLG